MAFARVSGVSLASPSMRSALVYMSMGNRARCGSRIAGRPFAPCANLPSQRLPSGSGVEYFSADHSPGFHGVECDRYNSLCDGAER